MSTYGELELLRETLVAVVNEMRANVIHASHSSIIYEGHDFSCAIVAADGRLVAQSLDDNPLHIFAVPYSTREVVKAFGDDIHEGDIFLHNDPYTGGTHLNDVLMLYPVFAGGHLALFAATRCHWGDVGGMTPGSLSGRVKEIFQEGIRIPPTRICERGRMNEAFLGLLFANMRIENERRGDFNTMLGASRKAAQHLERLFKRFGAEKMLDSIEEMIRRTEAEMRERIREWPDGTYHAEGYIESNGHSPEPLLARLALTIDDGGIIADLSGASPQTPGPTNIGPAMALNSVCTVVKAFMTPKTLINHGSFAPIEVINPPGTFINARAPAPCGGMCEVRNMIDSMVVAALGQARPERMVGDFKGGGNSMYIFGQDPHSVDDLFILYEYPAAGTGACDGHDGTSTTRAYVEGDFNAVQSVEVVEAQTPVRLDRYELREGCCGDGQFRGGFGMRRDMRLLRGEGNLSVLTERSIMPPCGVVGGRSGAANTFTVLRNGEPVETSPIPGKISDFPLRIGDIVRMETSGGGGFGDSLTRDPERVRVDVEYGYISRQQGEQRYGVVLTIDGDVDTTATETLRKSLAADRIEASLEVANEELRNGTRREFEIPKALARRLGVGQGSLMELSTGRGACLRGWARLDDAEEGEWLRLGPSGLDLLTAAPGDTIEVRTVRIEPA